MDIIPIIKVDDNHFEINLFLNLTRINRNLNFVILLFN